MEDPASATASPAPRVSPGTDVRPLGPHVRWLFAFQFANAVNFTLALGAPMVLLAKRLGAGESLLGVLLSLTPFLVTLQVLAGGLAERLGYKRLMMSGWGTRALLLLAAVPIPLLHGRVPLGWLLAWLTAVLFGFNLVRGFTSIAWLPWISQLVPEERRGRYFGIEQCTVNAGVLITLAGAGVFMGASPAAWRYAVLLGVSWLAGWVSVACLGRVPCRMPAAAAARARRPWRSWWLVYRAAWRRTAFRHTILFAASQSFALAAFPGFLLAYQKDYLPYGEGVILGLAALGTVGVMLTALFWGRFTDRFGSRPTLRLAGLLQAGLVLVWAAIAAQRLQAGIGGIALLSLLYGAAQTANAIPQLRLVLRLCPRHEVTVGITLYSVVTAVCGGLSPLLWGPVLEWLRDATPGHGLPHPFVCFFLATAALTLLAQLWLSRIREVDAVPTVRAMVALLRDWPLQLVSDTGWLGGLRRPR